MNRPAVRFGIGACCALWCAAALAAPEADLIPRTWQLDFTFHDPQRIALQLPGEARPTTYWYLLFTVTNETGRDVEFFPTFRLVTDTLQVVEGGAEISPSVYEAVIARHRKEYPFMAPPMKITGPILQGEDSARTSMAVFRMFDPKASAFTIYVTGLSGDIERVANPGYDAARPESEENPQFFIVRRTLAINYSLPGDPQTRHRASPVRRSREWVMR